MKKLSEIIQNSRVNGVAIPAFNIDCFEIYQAVENVVREIRLPVLVQLSAGEDTFIQAERLFMLVKKARLEGLPIYLNMDHGSDINRLKKMIKIGFDMVHFDGSKIDLDTNQMLAKDLVNFAHYYQSLVEVEFNEIKSTDSSKNAILTDPSAAKNFINQTSADFLAVSVGNRHGSDVNFPENIDLDLLQTIKSQLPPTTFITLHGGSGIPLSQIQTAIKQGIVKININTDLRQAYKKALVENIAQFNSDKIYELLKPVVDQVSLVVHQKILEFNPQLQNA